MSHDLNEVLTRHLESFRCDYCDSEPYAKCWAKKAHDHYDCAPHASRLKKSMFSTAYPCSYCHQSTPANGVVRCRYNKRLHVSCPHCRRRFGKLIGTFQMRVCAEQLTEADETMLALAKIK